MHFDAITYSLLKDRKLRNVAPLCTIETTGWTGSTSGEVLFTGDGTTKDFSGKVGLPPVNPLSSFVLHYTIGGTTYDATADENGNITGTHITSGTINQDGNYEIHFDTPPDDTTDGTADYNYGIEPSPIENIVDSNLETYAGPAWKKLTGSGIIGSLKIYPPKGIYLAGIRWSFYSLDGTGAVSISYALISSAGALYEGTLSPSKVSQGTTEIFRCSGSVFIVIDDITTGFKLDFGTNSAGEYPIKIFELFLYKLR
ncbi:MAG: hypothetical protein DRP29_04610 [Thermodesulfobacteriota bacterium]|nr:MAG: hypothetical protein DRP29_04610 [Thermodesulfobacteriota bacterium]